MWVPGVSITQLNNSGLRLSSLFHFLILFHYSDIVWCLGFIFSSPQIFLCSKNTSISQIADCSFPVSIHHCGTAASTSSSGSLSAYSTDLTSLAAMQRAAMKHAEPLLALAACSITIGIWVGLWVMQPPGFDREDVFERWMCRIEDIIYLVLL